MNYLRNRREATYSMFISGVKARFSLQPRRRAKAHLSEAAEARCNMVQQEKGRNNFGVRADFTIQGLKSRPEHELCFPTDSS